ncbi:hypothetical protein AtEden1_Chr2g0227661 [Arabidopsis thaliana]
MTSTPRSDGYRFFLNPKSPYPLFTELSLVQLLNSKDYTSKYGKPKAVLYFYVYSWLQTLCGMLNLHGLLHVREDPPVMLRLYILLVPARTLSLTSSSTPFCLLTLAILSSNDSLLEEASTNLDLTCSRKPLSFWFKALKDYLPINFIYSLIFMVVTLGYAFYFVVLNFGILESFYPCMWQLL